MKTFEDYLPTMTAREREIATCVLKRILQCEYELGLYCIDEAQKMEELMRSTPPANEPVSEECELKTGMHVGTQRPPLYAWPKGKRFNHGDRVRVVKIEEMK